MVEVWVVEALAVVDMSSAFCNVTKTCSMGGLWCVSAVQDRASWSVRSKASIEYSLSSLGSASSDALPALVRTFAWLTETLKIKTWAGNWKHKSKTRN